MTLPDILFLLFGGVVCLSGIALALTRNVVHAGFWLFAVLACVAALYVFAGAEFLGVSQLVLYVGGILIVLMFGIMLTQKMKDMDPRTEIRNVLPALMICGILFFFLHHVIQSIDFTDAEWMKRSRLHATTTPDVKMTGIGLLTKYLLPFEVISILLLAALAGAAYISRRQVKGKGGEA